MSDITKEFVPLEPSAESSDTASLDSSPSCHQRQRGKANWETYGFSSQASCEFGSIQFFKGSQKYNKNSKFMIVDPRESPTAVLKVLLEEWKLVLPKLLIHLVGGKTEDRARYDKSLGSVFAKALIQAMSHTDVWLLTDGRHCDVTASVGKVLADKATEIAMVTHHQLVAIGMGPASGTSQMEKLAQSVGGPVEYQVDLASTDAHTCLLDSSHTHFIIEEDRGQYNHGTLLRDALIDCITQCKIQQSDVNVPVVYVLYGGDKDSLHTIYTAVVKRNIPLIIVAGSGGVADVLTEAVNQPPKASNDNAGGEYDNDAEIEIMCSSHAHLVTVYKEDQKMDEAILLALMNANRGAGGQNELLLSVIWNRIDLVRTKLMMNKKWIDKFQDVQLTECLQYALVHNQHKFVELFLERYCIDLQMFLTKDRLIDLYCQIGSQSLLRKLLNDEKKHQAKALGSKPDLKDIGNILKQLVGLNSFTPGYLTQDNQEPFPSPCRELFIWAVLQHHKKMALVFWKYSGMSIGGALLASKLLKMMAGLVREPEVSLDMFQHGRVFQDRAIEVMNRCYAENQYSTYRLLTRVLPDWGNATCLEFAFAARNKAFISQAAVQKLWMGRLSTDTDRIVILICTLLPFAALSLVKFTSIDNLSKPAIKPVKQPLATSESIHTVSENLDSSRFDEADGQFRSLHKGFLSSLMTQDVPEPSRLAMWYKLKLFIEAPVIIFCYHLIFHLLFLMLFSYILLKDFTATQSPLEIVLMVWVGILFMEEFRELVQEDCDSLRGHFEVWLWGYWNIIDLIALLMFTIGMVLRYTFDMLDGARIVLALDLIVFYLRILHFFSVNKYLGPKLIMIVKMMMDIITFICILFVFLVAYGVAFQSILYPNEQDSLAILRGVLYQPYFQMYGELFLEDLHKDECERMTSDMTTPASMPIVCPQNSWFGTIVLAFYLFISNIMLLNLLIAMFNYTFTTVQDNTDTYWKFQRFQLVKEYHKRPVLAAPFTIFIHIYLVVRALWNCCFPKNKLPTGSSAMRKYIKDGQMYSYLSIWESVKGKDFLATIEKQHNRDVLHRIKQTDQRSEPQAEYQHVYDMFCHSVVQQQLIDNQEIMRMSKLVQLFVKMIKRHEGTDIGSYRLEKISTGNGATVKEFMHRLDYLQTQVDKRLSRIETQMNNLEHLLSDRPLGAQVH